MYATETPAPTTLTHESLVKAQLGVLKAMGRLKEHQSVKTHKRSKRQSSSYHARIQKKWDRRFGTETRFEALTKGLLTTSFRTTMHDSSGYMPCDVAFTMVRRTVPGAALNVEITKPRPPSMHSMSASLDQILP